MERGDLIEILKFRSLNLKKNHFIYKLKSVINTFQDPDNLKGSPTSFALLITHFKMNYPIVLSIDLKA